MKNIEEYILEKEYDEVFLIEEGFFSWLAKIGKKFWSWLTGKDYTSKDVDWNVGDKKKLQWVAAKQETFEKIKNNKGLAENFPSTMRVIDRSPNLRMMQAVNANKTPVVMILITNDKKTIAATLKKNIKNFDKFKNRVANVENPVMIVSIEVAKGNNEDNEDIFYDYVLNELNNNLFDKFDIVFLDTKHIHSSYLKMFQYEFDYDKAFPAIDAHEEWDSISDDAPEGQEEEENQEEKEKNKQELKNKAEANKKEIQNKVGDKPAEKESNKGEEVPNKDDGDLNIEKNKAKDTPKTLDNKIEFFDTSNDNEIVATAEFSADVDKIKEVTKININHKDFYNFLITRLDINDKYKVEQYENIIDDFILPVICNKLGEKIKDLDESKEIKIYIKLSGEEFADHIKKLRKLSTTKKIKIKESINEVFIIIGKTSSEMIKTSKELQEQKPKEEKPVKESLDIDNLFWMLDTWFANNEPEKTSFMSIVDNCIIKKTYNKNDLAKLCDNINFDIRPFINFISRDAVTKPNQAEDHECDYYYELKKIIDALISNKATNNKYVRFS